MLRDRKSTRLNSSHTVIYTLSLHDALPISLIAVPTSSANCLVWSSISTVVFFAFPETIEFFDAKRSEEHTSELQSHSDLHSFPTRRSSDLIDRCANFFG